MNRKGGAAPPATARFAGSRATDGAVLVTGATSLLGRLVVEELLDRGRRVVILVRPASPHTAETLARSIDRAGVERTASWAGVTVVRGDLWEPDFGLGVDELGPLRDVTEILHLGRPRATAGPLLGALVKGHDTVLDLARRLSSLRRLVVLSTTDVAGGFLGRFYEDWLDIGQPLKTQRAREAVDAEMRVQSAGEHLPLCIARHAMLVGHSRTGQMECDAGFERILAWGAATARLPSFVRVPGPGAGERYLTVSPVDFVARGLVEIAMSAQIARSQTFCLADSAPPSLAALHDLVLRRCGGPAPGVRIPVDERGPVGLAVGKALRAGAAVATAMGRSPGLLGYLTRRGDYDTVNAARALEPAGITCPPLETYFDALYGGYRRRSARG